MAKPLLKFKKLSETEFQFFAQKVITSMRDEEGLYPDCDPPLDHLENTYRRLVQATADAFFHDRQKVEIKNQLMEQMKSELHQLSLYVAKIAKGDPLVIVRTGFDFSKSWGPVGVAPKANNFKVTPLINNPGEAKFKVDVWSKATAYLFEYRKVGDTIWTSELSTKSSMLVIGLEPRVAYEARSAYVARDPTRTFSDVIQFYVL